MTGPAEVLGGVLMRAGITAADVAARQAHPQMSPVIDTVRRALPSHTPGVRGWWFVDLLREMRARRRRRRLVVAPTESLDHAVGDRDGCPIGRVRFKQEV